jgi:transposase
MCTIPYPSEPYPSDLSDAERAILRPLRTPLRSAGHPRVLELRRIVEAVFDLLRSGCQWRAIPHEFPRWPAVYWHYAKWRRDGTWEEVNAMLRRCRRVASGRAAQPTAAIIDSQSVCSTEAGGPRGYDGGKNISGRKRHVLVDTQGNLLKVRVHPADLHDRHGAEILLQGLATQCPLIALIWADIAYRGLKDWLATTLGWKLVIVKHWWTGLQGVWVAPGQQPPEIPRGFHVLPRRWVVERTFFAWIGRNRRMARDYEPLVQTGEMLTYMAMSRVMLRRSAKTAT